MENFLLVDDDDISTFLNNKAVEELGCANKINTASNGKHALDILKHSMENSRPIPDIILLDLNMPIMDGFDFLKSLKNLEIPHVEKIKVIVVTSSADESDLDKAKALGASNYLTKPLTPEKLRQALEV